jgi:hypothetical protein
VLKTTRSGSLDEGLWVGTQTTESLEGRGTTLGSRMRQEEGQGRIGADDGYVSRED